MAFKFQGVDFIQFDSLLSDDELIVRASTRAFVEDNLIPIIEQCNRDGRFPRELVRPMGELGFYGATLEGYGCAGVNNVEYGLLMQELERGDSGIRHVSHLCLWLGPAERYLVAEDGHWRKTGLLRAHGT